MRKCYNKLLLFPIKFVRISTKYTDFITGEKPVSLRQ